MITNMNCPTCQAPMREGASNFTCEVAGCLQIPVCKGCFEPMCFTGPGINEYYCGNKSCPRTPAQNLKDLFSGKYDRYRIVDTTDPRYKAALQLEGRFNNCFHCGTKLTSWNPAVFEDGKEVAREETPHKWCTNCCWVVFKTLCTLMGVNS